MLQSALGRLVRIAGIGSIRLDIDFVNSGTRTILKSTELKPAVSPDPDCKFPRAKRVSRKVAAK